MLITATDLPRLMACNGSRLMEGFISSIESDDTVRNEGDAAHWVAEQVFKGNFTASELIDRKAPNGVFITAEMIEYLIPYLEAIGRNGVIEHSGIIKGSKWQISTRADHADINSGILKISDLKYGWRIVEPENNWTLIAYALAAIPGYMGQYNKAPEFIELFIYQPRAHHHNGRIRSWRINYAELHTKMLELYRTLDNLDDQLHTGEHCYKCPALVNCPAARKAELNAVEASEKAYVDKINNADLAFQLDHLDRSIDVLIQTYKAYSELALHRLKQGEILSNYAIEADLTNNTWKEHITPEIIQAMTGIDATKKQLVTPNQAKDLGINIALITPLTERRTKGVKLIRVNTNNKARKLFNK